MENYKELIFWCVILFFVIIALYESNKHSCYNYLVKNMKSCKLKDGYYHMEFELKCRICNKIHSKQKSKFPKLKINE
jgi:CRISPR/Cas system-associated protein endoribonuclease Cas2